MILVPFFEIPYEDRLAKNVKKRYVQVLLRSTDKVAVCKFTQTSLSGYSACLSRPNEQETDLINFVCHAVMQITHFYDTGGLFCLVTFYFETANKPCYGKSALIIGELFKLSLI